MLLVLGFLLAIVPNVLGILGTVRHARLRAEGKGSWGVFAAVALVSCVIVFGVAYAIGMPNDHDPSSPYSAPPDSFYFGLIALIGLVVSGPGIGLTLGWLVARGYKRA